jgi:hypothetical protein
MDLNCGMRLFVRDIHCKSSLERYPFMLQNAMPHFYYWVTIVASEKEGYG